ncbi:hypothetical protein [Mycolicibacterium mucogenicum]|nr:hypothetical protein [Mycolicibacterium mucogenicum]
MPQRQGVVDQSLLDATAAAIARWGLHALTLERVGIDGAVSPATI